jgi:hypothetical protein
MREALLVTLNSFQGPRATPAKARAADGGAWMLKQVQHDGGVLG